MSSFFFALQKLSVRMRVRCRMEFDFDAIDEEDSPYPEVRAAVSNIDDPEMPTLTIRMWIVGLLLNLTVA